MKQLLLSVALFFILTIPGRAQQPVADIDTVSKAQVQQTAIWPFQSWVSPNAPESHTGRYHSHSSDSWRIILAAGLLLLLGICRRVFEKYFADLMGLMFRSTVKSRQIREQMQNRPLPSLAFNLFFVIASGLFLFLLAEYYGARPYSNQWLFLLLCMGSVFGVYLVKFIALKFFGWLFNNAEITGTYIFIVFYINKIIGILLSPVLLLLLLAGTQLSGILVVISLFGIGLLLLYRYILVYNPAWRAVQMPVFHFFLYICAVEIAPLLLIYKVLFQFADNEL